MSIWWFHYMNFCLHRISECIAMWIGMLLHVSYFIYVNVFINNIHIIDNHFPFFYVQWWTTEMFYELEDSHIAYGNVSVSILKEHSKNEFEVTLKFWLFICQENVTWFNFKISLCSSPIPVEMNFVFIKIMYTINHCHFLSMAISLHSYLALI